MYKNLYGRFDMNHLSLKNRWVRSATFEGLATEKGYLTQPLLKIYKELSENEIGLIMTSYTYVQKNGLSTSNMMGNYEETFIESYRALTQEVHKNGTKIMMQLVHAGSFVRERPERAIGPSAVANKACGVTPSEMTQEDIEAVIKAFSDASLRCKKASFDGVQIHAAHGYLLSQFLDPYHNQRTDQYGGSITNRSRIILEVYHAVRDKVGKDYHISMKINCRDFRADGFQFEECIDVCKRLDAAGIDSIEISGGDWRTRQDESFYLEEASAIADLIKCPVILTGGNRDIKKIEKILNKTNIQLIGLSRPLLAEPDLINRWSKGDEKKSKCINCSRCLKNNPRRCIFYSE